MDVQARAKNILLQPAREWRVIAGESADVASLLRHYAAPPSAIPAVCRAVAAVRYAGLLRSAPDGQGTWVFGLVGVWLAAIVIERLAPNFGSRGGTVQALKTVVYASTPVWIAGVLALAPPLGALVLLAALYAIYLFYVGLPIVMHTPSDK